LEEGKSPLLQLHPRKHKKEEMSHSVRHDRKKQGQRRFLTAFGMTGKQKIREFLTAFGMT